MTKKDGESMENQVMTDCYNLLLNPDISPEERELLLAFKKEVEGGQDFSRETYRLARYLEHLSLKFLQDKKSLSEPVEDFYKLLNNFQKAELAELRNNEIAKGIIAASGSWL